MKATVEAKIWIQNMTSDMKDKLKLSDFEIAFLLIEAGNIFLAQIIANNQTTKINSFSS